MAPSDLGECLVERPSKIHEYQGRDETGPVHAHVTEDDDAVTGLDVLCQGVRGSDEPGHCLGVLPEPPRDVVHLDPDGFELSLGAVWRSDFLGGADVDRKKWFSRVQVGFFEDSL